MTITHNQIIKLLNDVADNHRMINGFGFGDPWEYLGENTPDTVCLWGVDLEHRITKNVLNETSTIDLNYKLLVFDLVDKGENNENDVLSDTLQIALDALAVLGYKTFSDLYSFSYSTIKPFTEKFDSEVSGHEVDITFRIPFDNNICQVPLDAIPVGYTSCASGYTWDGVPSTRTLTINGVTYDLSDNRTWTIATGGSETLAQTLVLGNTTGANDIIHTSTTASTVPYLDVSKKLVSSAVTPTQLSYLDATSSIQTQLNSKQATLVSATNLKTVGGVSLLGAGDIGSISTAYTDAKIKGSIAASNRIAFGNGVLDTVTDSASLIFNGTSINVGGTSYSQTINGYAQTSATTGYIGLKNTGAATFQGLYFEGATTEGYLVKMNAFAGNHTGTSIPFAQTLYFRNGATSTEPFLLIGTPVYQLAGQTSTNYGSRLDTLGLRVGLLSTLHTANTVAFQVDGAGIFGTAAANNGFIFNVGTSTSQFIFREKIGTTTQAAFYIGVASGSESSTNYTLNYNGTLNLNSQSSTSPIALKLGDNSAFTITPANTGSTSFYGFAVRSRTTLTTTANIPTFDVTGNTHTWATGTVALQYFTHFRSQTAACAGASTFTFITSTTFEMPIRGSNSTFGTAVGIYVPTIAYTSTTTATGAYFEAPTGATTNWSAIFTGNLNFSTNASKIEATGTGSNGLLMKNLKNSANTTVSGTAKTVEIDIAGTPYYFLIYPTSTA